MSISRAQLRSILGLIEDHHLAFMAEMLGLDTLEKAEIAHLEKQGLLPGKSVDIMEKAYVYGVENGAAPSRDLSADMTVLDFIRYTKVASPALSSTEKVAVEHAKRNAGAYIRGLSSQCVKKAQAAILEADRKLHRSNLLKTRKVIAQGIGERATIKEISEKLKAIIVDQKRDFLKIAATEVNNALQEGRLQAIVKSSGHGEDPLVFKRPSPDACPYCKLLYLEKSGQPRLFRLSDLVANGSNVGRRAGKPIAKSCGWKACVESTHPYCRCQLNYMPPGFDFDKKGSMIYLGRKKVA